MEEIRDPQALPEVIRNLTTFDDSLAQRVHDIKANHSPNGHTPGMLLNEAIEGKDPSKQQKFIDEYRWALALSAYRYEDLEAKHTLMAAAEDGLFIAGETYNPREEPNFLVHLSETVDRTLKEVFGPVSGPLLLTAAQFEDFISAEYNSTPPPLANERTAADFAVGDQVLFLVGARLANTTVHLATAYSSPLTLGPARAIPAEALEKRQALLAERQEELREAGYRSGIMPDKELLRLGMLLCPEFQELVPNPSPGFVHLKTAEDQNGIITDMNHNYIIPMTAWNYIRRAGSYREAWLANGSSRSIAMKDTLLQAIHTRVIEETRADKQPRKPGRARPRHGAPVKQLNHGRSTTKIYPASSGG